MTMKTILYRIWVQLKIILRIEILKYYIRNGYPSITLCKNNTKKTFNIHTIVASHFLEKLEGIFVVNHKNEDKQIVV